MLIKKCDTAHTIHPYPKLRNFVLDVMEEGRRKNTIHSLFDVDVTHVRDHIRTYKLATGTSLSFTGYIAHCYARAISEQKHMQALRQGKKLYVFESVDIAVMVEKEVDGFIQPVNYIMRDAETKSLYEIHHELRRVQKIPVGQDMALNHIEHFFFKLPHFLRKIFWYFSRKKPELRKQFLGTVGLTSVGMFGNGQNFLIPITPMPLTLTIGTITKRPVELDGKLSNLEMLSLTISVDHNITDGGPLMRFISLLKEMITEGFNLPPVPIIMAAISKTPPKLS